MTNRTVTKIGECAFERTTIKSITIPASITHIENRTFSFCYKLEKLILPENLEYLDNWCLYGCLSLKELILPKGLKYLGINCLGECRSLSYIDVSEELINKFDKTNIIKSFDIKELSYKYLTDKSVNYTGLISTIEWYVRQKKNRIHMFKELINKNNVYAVLKLLYMQRKITLEEFDNYIYLSSDKSEIGEIFIDYKNMLYLLESK